MIMAKGAKPRPEPLTLGDVFAVRLPDGRYGAVRAIRLPTKAEGWNQPHVSLVAFTQYVADAPPTTIKEKSLRRLMMGTHGVDVGKVCGSWLAGPVPPEYLRVGNLPATHAEQKLKCNSFIGWPYIGSHLLAEWRYVHDRAAWQAEIDEIEREHKALVADLERRDAETRATMTYASFRKQPMFQDWADAHPPKIPAAARKIMRDTATKLEKLGKKPDRHKARTILRKCIVAFNELDAANDHFITTIEREDIDERFATLATLAGLSDEPELADEWRDW